MSLELYTDGDSYIYKPKEIEGFLLLNYNKKQKQIYYKFFNDKLTENVKKVEDPQYAVSLYNLFQKYLTEIGDIDVICLSTFNDEEEEEECPWEEEETPELDEFFGFEYYEETDVLRDEVNGFITRNPTLTGLSEEQMQNINTLSRNQLIISFINIKLQEDEEFNELTPYEIHNIREWLNNHNLNIN